MSDRSRDAKSTDPRVEAALRDYLERIDRGEAVNREEFISRHSDIADALRSFIAAEEELRKLARERTSRESAGTSTQTFAAPGQETVPPKAQPDRSAKATGSGLSGQFGRYQIIRALGKGAMGAVYLAEDSQLERKVAIKTPHFDDDPAGDLIARFYREARAAATLRHANICPVHDVGEIDGKHFISMAYIEGLPLSELIQSGKVQNERHIVIAVHKLARALQDAHDQGIVHRDLKPANIMVDKKGEPIIMDFGLARKPRKDGEASLTQSGAILGSPAYMSPEQIEADAGSVGPASDQYSLGVVLYEMLTGQLPFRGSVINVLAQIITKGPSRPSELRAGLDPRIEAVCLKMMAKKPSERFPSMKAVADQLAAIVKNPAATPSRAERLPTASRAPAAATPTGDEARASQVRKSVKQKALSESDVASLEELARKCLRRHDYDQIIQIIERIPEDHRNESLDTLLEKAREKIDEIAFLICEADEADRLEDAQSALKKAEELLKIKPGHHRAREIQEKYSGYRDGGAARIASMWQFTRPWSEGGWIPWSVLAFGLIVFAGMYGVIVIYLGNNTALVIKSTDPGIEVALKGHSAILTAPGTQTVNVEPGVEQELKVRYAGLETQTRYFKLTKGETKKLEVGIVDSRLVARLADESLETLSKESTPPAKNTHGENPQQALTPPSTPHAAEPPTVASNDPRRFWRGSDCSFENTGRGKWRETLSDNTLIGNYDEVERTQEYVELLDRSRAGGTRVRLRTDDYLVQIAGEGEAWRPVESGRWQSATTSPVQRTATDGFAPLFNGKDLTGWKTHPSQPGSWRVKGGSLIGSGPGFLSFLYSERNDFKDFHLRVEARVNEGGNSGLFFRSGFGPVNPADVPGSFALNPAGYEVDIMNPETGTLLRSGGKTLVKATNSTARDGEWFTLEVIARNDHIETKVNGSTTADFHAEPAGFDRGHIALQQWGSETVVEFRKIEIKELTPLSAAALAPAADPDRLGAEWVLSIGGSVDVNVNGQEVSYIKGVADLPRDPFELTNVVLWDNKNFDDAGLKKLKDCTHIWHLGLGQTNVTDAGLANFEGRTNITYLGLNGTKATDTGLANFKECTNLTILALYGTKVTDAGLANFKHCSNLHLLDVSVTEVTDAGLANFKDCTNLTRLGLRATKVTDAGLAYFTGCKNLEHVDVKDTKVTAAGVKKLAEALPGCEIEWDGGDIAPKASNASDGKDRSSATTANSGSDSSAEGFVPLFNGKDRTGWKPHPSQPGNWHVANGMLIGEGPAASHLYTVRGNFKDFDLRVEARINAGGNSGVIFRSKFGPSWPTKHPRFPLGYEAQIDSTSHEAKTGSLFAITGGAKSGSAVVAVPDSPVPAGQWFTLEIIARGSQIVINVDGVETTRYSDTAFKRGHIALQQHDANTVVEFRKIEIKDLTGEAGTQ